METSQILKTETGLKVDYSKYLIDQIRAADDAQLAIRELELNGTLDPNNEHHRAVIETDVFRLRRGLCLPSAASVAINLIKGERLIGDSDGVLTIGDYFRFLLPHHGKYPTPEQPNGWYVISPSGDMYHQSIVAFSEALDINAYSCQGISSLEQLSPVLKVGGSVAVSLNNHFVIDHTLSTYPDTVQKTQDQILIRVNTPNGQEYRPFQDGRHVVTLLDIYGGEALIADSFNLPQTGKTGLTVSVPVNEVNKYLTYHDNTTSRSIVFLPQDIQLPPDLHPTPLRIPDEVVSDLSQKIGQKLAQTG
jgi:hypothetical protein